MKILKGIIFVINLVINKFKKKKKSIWDL